MGLDVEEEVKSLSIERERERERMFLTSYHVDCGGKERKLENKKRAKL